MIFNEEVQNALADKKPIVALESTVIAHGLPFPQNLETARNLERIVREARYRHSKRVCNSGGYQDKIDVDLDVPLSSGGWGSGPRSRLDMNPGC